MACDSGTFRGCSGIFFRGSICVLGFLSAFVSASLLVTIFFLVKACFGCFQLQKDCVFCVGRTEFLFFSDNELAFVAQSLAVVSHKWIPKLLCQKIVALVKARAVADAVFCTALLSNVSLLRKNITGFCLVSKLESVLQTKICVNHHKNWANTGPRWLWKHKSVNVGTNPFISSWIFVFVEYHFNSCVTEM